MTLETDNRDRLITAGCVVLLVIALLLAAAAILVSIAVQGFFDRPAPPDDEVLAKKAGLTGYQLHEATRDGALTDKEITHAAGDARWGRARDASTTKITVAYTASGGAATCYRFILSLPLTDRTLVNLVRLADCPTNLSEPGAS
ncbi:hypothetical protein [Streptomyces flaveus]|uniref:Uncharacterized protein n=1 Tax=Streptomyces flaveus TaxID=66370 RepID=A0A917R9R1_9ACTN|nr:hypothetical protein [Streptomyces flaveus]GGK97510.1 hypothetical protein GCM10010094_68020 [Streptomyces flaveus]